MDSNYLSVLRSGSIFGRVHLRTEARVRLSDIKATSQTDCSKLGALSAFFLLLLPNKSKSMRQRWSRPRQTCLVFTRLHQVPSDRRLAKPIRQTKPGGIRNLILRTYTVSSSPIFSSPVFIRRWPQQKPGQPTLDSLYFPC